MLEIIKLVILACTIRSGDVSARYTNIIQKECRNRVFKCIQSKNDDVEKVLMVCLSEN